MTVLSQTPTSTKTTTPTAASQTSKGSKSGTGGGGYTSQSGHLAPLGGGGFPTSVTIAGVTLSAGATGATFLALEEALGPDWKTSARKAAGEGGAAVLALVAPHLPVAARNLPLAHDLADAYARWALTQPKDVGAKKSAGGKGDAGEPGKGDKKNIDAGTHGLMVSLEEAIGKLIGPLAPVAGRSVGAHVKGAASVEGIYLAMGAELEAERTTEGFEVGGSASIAIGVGTTSENAAIEEKISVKGHGDDEVEAMHMAGLAVEHWMRSQQFDWKNPSLDSLLSTGKKFLVNVAALQGPGGPMGVMGAGALALAGGKIADALWGKSFEADIVKQMDEDDYGESSIGVGVGAHGGSDDVGLDVGVGYTHTNRVQNINGAVGTETEDVFSGHFGLEVEAGSWKLGVGGQMDVPASGESADVGLEITVGRTKSPLGATEVVGQMAASTVRGLAQKVAKRAGGWVGRIADAVEVAFGVKAAGEALLGGGELKLTADYDYTKGELTVALVVTRAVEIEAEDGAMASVSMGFEMGQQVFSQPFQVGRP